MSDVMKICKMLANSAQILFLVDISSLVFFWDWLSFLPKLTLFVQRKLARQIMKSFGFLKSELGQLFGIVSG